MAYHVYTTEGFVLRSAPLGESDKYFYILTDELGLIIASAKSVRALASKLRPSLNDYTRGIFSFIHGKSSWKLIGASSLGNSMTTLNSKDKRLIWARFNSRLRKLIQGEEKNSDIFYLAESFHKELSLRDFSFQELLALEILASYKLLSLLGYGTSKGEYSIFTKDLSFSDDLLSTALLNKEALLADVNEALFVSQI